MGCSHQSVPSLSNTAMRSEGGTKSGEPSFVTFATKARMAFFGAVSFHDGSGSVPDGACERTSAGIPATSNRSPGNASRPNLGSLRIIDVSQPEWMSRPPRDVGTRSTR